MQIHASRVGFWEVSVPALQKAAFLTVSPCDFFSMHVQREKESLPLLKKTLVISDSLVARSVKSLPAMQGPKFDPWVGKTSWRREWQPTPVFLPGEFHGQRSLVGYSLWSHKESGTTDRLTHTVPLD